MSDIFISYARPNEPLARKAAEALRTVGTPSGATTNCPLTAPTAT